MAQPIYQLIARLALLRRANPALLHGRQVARASGGSPGLFAVSRIDPATGHEILVAFNTSTSRLDAHVLVDAHSSHFESLYGSCAADSDAPGSYHVRLEALDFVICAAGAAP